MSQNALPGFRDFYPAEMSERNHIVRAWREVARRYAFSEYDGPPLESLDLYTRKSGDEIVSQLYTFEDKGGRLVALRPEMTPTFARMVAARANALRKPVRWFSIPQLFRYERQQKGRLREHFQLNADIVGEADVTADAELLALAVDIMKELGLASSDVRARVSDRRLLQALLLHAGVPEAQLGVAYGAVDRMDREKRGDAEERLAAAGVPADAIRFLFELARPMTADALRAEYGGHPALQAHVALLDRYFAHLEALGVADWVQLDLSIVRGLAYYTGIVFELFDRRGEFRAICGGGRYDSLLDALGGVDEPALGFGMGDVVLGELLRARKLMPAAAPALDYWVAADDEALLPSVMSLAAALRTGGHSVEYALRPQKLGRQLKSAAAAGAVRAVILSATESANGRATVRTLADGSERVVALAQLRATPGGYGVVRGGDGFADVR